MRYFIELSYHGANYHGWQIQPQAITVQETLEKALSLLLKKPVQVVGCGRTDAGVHASQFFLHFDIDERIDKSSLKYRLNSFLPADIAIFRIYDMKHDAHARFDAICRKYNYIIDTQKNPFNQGLSMTVTGKLDIHAMNAAAERLLNYEDFKCFSRSKTDVKNYLCDVSEAFWKEGERQLIFEIKANRFLRNMVRAVVGTLLEVGRGKMNVDEFERVIQSRDRTKAGASAKAEGLYLSEIIYPEAIFLETYE